MPGLVFPEASDWVRAGVWASMIPQIAKSGVNQRRLPAELFERCVVRGGELEVGPRSMEVQVALQTWVQAEGLETETVETEWG